MSARLRSESKLYVACSGGADSVFALLVVYLFLRNENSLGKLSVLHLDHALRGEESDGDSLFVRDLCDSLSILFLDAKADWKKTNDQVSEVDAREARLSFFARTCEASEERPACIATGHHADDVVETVLMRLSRGAGVQGLSAPRELSTAGNGLVFIRPILDWGRDEIRKLLARAEITWREDSTNASDKNYRARLRKGVIPSWEDTADRPIRPGVCRSRRLLEEDAEALDLWADGAWEKLWSKEEQALARDGVTELPIALQRRLISRVPNGGGVATPAQEELLRALAGGEERVIEARSGWFYKLCSKWLRLVEVVESDASAWNEFVLPQGGVAYLPNGARVSCSAVNLDLEQAKKLCSGGNDDRKAVYLVPMRNSGSSVTVRLRQPGDAFKPYGKSSPKKLKDLFIERKIDRRERDTLPVFIGGEDGILWVPGLPPNADCTLALGSDAALRLTYER